MANPFNLADEGGWELVEIYPLPELVVVAPASQELVQGDVVLQAQDFSACPLNNVVFYVTDIFAQVSAFPAIYNDGTGNVGICARHSEHADVKRHLYRGRARH
jgi:hypothetical protein